MLSIVKTPEGKSIHLNLPHPEQSDDEVYLCNHFWRREWESGKQAPLPGWKTVRLGDVAYDIYGAPLSPINRGQPVFVKRSELEEAGFAIEDRGWMERQEVEDSLNELTGPVSIDDDATTPTP